MNQQGGLPFLISTCQGMTAEMYLIHGLNQNREAHLGLLQVEGLTGNKLQ